MDEVHGLGMRDMYPRLRLSMSLLVQSYTCSAGPGLWISAPEWRSLSFWSDRYTSKIWKNMSKPNFCRRQFLLSCTAIGCYTSSQYMHIILGHDWDQLSLTFSNDSKSASSFACAALSVLYQIWDTQTVCHTRMQPSGNWAALAIKHEAFHCTISRRQQT